ncbi:MAG: hypothetical protein ACK56I_16690, partial [bacterium]
TRSLAPEDISGEKGCGTRGHSLVCDEICIESTLHTHPIYTLPLCTYPIYTFPLYSCPIRSCAGRAGVLAPLVSQGGGEGGSSDVGDEVVGQREPGQRRAAEGTKEECESGRGRKRSASQGGDERGVRV